MFQNWLKEKGVDKVVKTFEAYLQKKPSGRAPGLDKISFVRYKEDHDFLEQEARIVFAKLTDRLRPRYIFTPFLQTKIPKDKSLPLSEDNSRPIAQATIRDAIVQMLMLEYLEKFSNVQFVKTSFAYQRGKSPLDAAQAIRDYVNEGFIWAYDADLSKFFDSIPHDLLLAKVQKIFPEDAAFKKLMERFLKAEIRPVESFSTKTVQNIKGKVRSAKHCRPRDIDNPHVGIPQGGILSGYLANLFLHDFDCKILENGSLRYIRYADDFIILSKTEDQIRAIEPIVAAELDALQVTLNKIKTKTRCERYVPGLVRKPGFAFVGFVFRNGTISAKQKNVASFTAKLQTLVLYEKHLTAEKRVEKVTYRLYQYQGKSFSHIGYPRSRRENQGIYLSVKQWAASSTFAYYLDEIQKFFKEEFDEDGELVRYCWLTYFHMINDPAQIAYLSSVYKEVIKSFYELRYGDRPDDARLNRHPRFKSFYEHFYGFIDEKKRQLMRPDEVPNDEMPMATVL